MGALKTFESDVANQNIAAIKNYVTVTANLVNDPVTG
jgi:hypothetical protein